MAHKTEARMRNVMRSSSNFRLSETSKDSKRTSSCFCPATEYKIVFAEEYFYLIPNSKIGFHLIKQKGFSFRTADGSSKRIEKSAL